MADPKPEPKPATVVHSNQAEWKPSLDQGPFQQRRKALGGDKLSSGLWELAPGKKSFPFHAHQITEESLFILQGTCTLRTQQGEQILGPGDFVHFPAGGTAHQLINHSTEPCQYLGISATQGFDSTFYPDTDKVAVSLGSPATGGQRFMFKRANQADYFDGEK